MNDEGRTQREVNEGGEAGRGEHGLRAGVLEGGNYRGGRKIRA